MRVLAFAVSTTSEVTSSWVADRDCVLVGVQETGGANVLVSEDPSLTVTELLSPTVTRIYWTIYAWLSGGTVFGNVAPPMRIPISAGKTLLVVTKAAKTAVLLYLDDPISPEP
jgi:hypothetical protein